MSTVKSSRRHFLQSATKALGAAGLGSLFMDTALAHLYGSAFAATTGTTPLDVYYIHLSLSGGLPRWQFDLPLKPYSDSTFVGAQFGTSIEALTAGYKVNYLTKPYKVSPTETLNLPPVWFMGNGSQDFRTLLPNFCMIRGVNMEVNSHPISNARQVATNIGGLSISGVVADVTGTPIPAIQSPTSAANVFKSKKGLAPLAMSPTAVNPVKVLLNAFRGLASTAKFASADWKSARDQAFAQLDHYAMAS